MGLVVRGEQLVEQGDVAAVEDFLHVAARQRLVLCRPHGQHLPQVSDRSVRQARSEDRTTRTYGRVLGAAGRLIADLVPNRRERPAVTALRLSWFGAEF